VRRPAAAVAVLRRAGPLAAVALLAGCATTRLPPPQQPATVSWHRRRAVLQCLGNWRMRGRMALAARNNGWTADVDWHQHGSRYDLRVSGPFGWGGFRLHGNPTVVYLDTGGKHYRFLESPEAVIRQQFDMTIPVSGMRYWVLGTWAPGSRPEHRLDRYGRLSHLVQQGWKIDYQDYTRSSGIMMPSRITMKRSGVRLKLVVDRWTLTDAGHCRGGSGKG